MSHSPNFKGFSRIFCYFYSCLILVTSKHFPQNKTIYEKNNLYKMIFNFFEKMVVPIP